MTIEDEERISRNLAKLTPLSSEQLAQLQKLELEAIARFHGNLDELESALGFLRLGMHYGWKPMAIIHSKKTFKKYEAILGIDARVLFAESTPTSDRSIGYLLAKKVSNFWKVVSGDIKIENRRGSSPE